MKQISGDKFDEFADKVASGMKGGFQFWDALPDCHCEIYRESAMKFSVNNAELHRKLDVAIDALEWINNVAACDYEYVNKAKEALGKIKGNLS